MRARRTSTRRPSKRWTTYRHHARSFIFRLCRLRSAGWSAALPQNVRGLCMNRVCSFSLFLPYHLITASTDLRHARRYHGQDRRRGRGCVQRGAIHNDGSRRCHRRGRGRGTLWARLFSRFHCNHSPESYLWNRLCVKLLFSGAAIDAAKPCLAWKGAKDRRRK